MEQFGSKIQFYHTDRSAFSAADDVKKSRMKSLQDYGYSFKDGKLRETGKKSKRFKFNYLKNPEQDQQRYDEIGKLVEDYVYLQLEKECKMERLSVPKGGSKDYSDSTFIFASRDYEKKDSLIVMIHGSGVVRAGQWSRRLIINESMERGSQIPYVKKAKKRDYAVIVLNTNDNSRDGKPIKGSETPEKHAEYVWKNYISESNAKYIAIVAHSYGGIVTTHLAKTFTTEFRDKVFAVALTDASVRRIPDDFHDGFIEMSRNWIGKGLPVDTSSGLKCVYARTRKHEKTSHKAINEVFRFIVKKKMKKISFLKGKKLRDESNKLKQTRQKNYLTI